MSPRVCILPIVDTCAIYSLCFACTLRVTNSRNQIPCVFQHTYLVNKPDSVSKCQTFTQQFTWCKKKNAVRPGHLLPLLYDPVLMLMCHRGPFSSKPGSLWVLWPVCIAYRLFGILCYSSSCVWGARQNSLPSSHQTSHDNTSDTPWPWMFHLDHFKF